MYSSYVWSLFHGKNGTLCTSEFNDICAENYLNKSGKFTNDEW